MRDLPTPSSPAAVTDSEGPRQGVRLSGMVDNWEMSDAWVFMAVAHASESEPADLVDVVGAADAINHAVLTYGEINGAARRLVAAGLLAVDDDRLSLTDQGRDLRRRCPDTAVHDAIAWTHTALVDGHPVGPPPPWRLDERRYHRAIDEHLRRFTRYLNRHPRQPDQPG